MLKAKRKVLTLLAKQKLLREVDAGNVKRKDVVKMFGISEAVVSGIVKYGGREVDEIAAGTGAKRQRLRTCTYEDVDAALVKWFQQARASNIPVCGPLIKEKALEIALKLGHDSFTASNGWFEWFKRRNGITFNKQCGEEKAVDDATVAEWKDELLPAISEGYAPKDVFDCDETPLFL